MHIEPTDEAGAAFFGSSPEDPIVMLNLLRYREVADYAAHPEFAPISGVVLIRRCPPFPDRSGG